MPGRQSHGRSVAGAGSGGGNKRRQPTPKSKSKSRAQDAFSIANKELGGDKEKRTPRMRELDVDLGAGKRRRAADDEDDEDDDDEDDEDDAPPKKRRAAQGEEGDIEYGSDSSGNEWRIGVGDDDEDSDIDSDEAFGASDDEKFQGYSFGGKSKDKKKKKGKNQAQDDDSSDDDDDLESLGSDAIDLADALDMSMSDDDDVAEGEEQSDEEDSGSDDSGSSEESEDSESDVSESGVKKWVDKFSGIADDEEETVAPIKSKIDLKDLGMLGGLDPSLKKSLKLMAKEGKSSKPQKLEVPLARRQQARLDRGVAYEQANKTLDRWTETVKHNRRADHLVFPLAQTETGLARHDNTEIAPLDGKTPGNELEQTIMGIVEASGLVPKADNEPKEYVNEDGESVTRKEYWAAKRREREVKSREEARAKRIKKIKSKAYHRVHRREREKNELKDQEALVAAGLVDSEDEREARDRQRATERMGARHRDSKWAKMAKKGGLAVWDDSVREGMTDMARRDEELRRRVDGRGDGSGDEESDYSADSADVNDRKRLLKELQSLDGEDQDSAPQSRLMNMAFMKKAENRRKDENDDMIKQIRRELASDEEMSEPEPEAEDIGRKQFGVANTVKELAPAAAAKSKKDKTTNTKDLNTNGTTTATNKVDKSSAPAVPATIYQEAADETAGAWSAAAPSKPHRRAKKQKENDNSVDVLDIDSSAAFVKPSVPTTRPKAAKNVMVADRDSSDDDDRHLVQFRDQELLDKAFGGLDVVADFEAEKRAQEEEDDEKVIDNTIPGWGSWVGDGVSAKETKRHAGRFLTKQEGIKKNKRKDSKLKNVIVNEKTIKVSSDPCRTHGKHHCQLTSTQKNNKYLASQLPHTFENSTQYERSLRVPVGPEWVTKKTHQDAVKPRVIVKQGIIAPMAKPFH